MRPSTSSAVYSGGPKRSANAASGGAISVSMITPNVPAIHDPTAAMHKAAPARPFCAMA